MIQLMYVSERALMTNEQDVTDLVTRARLKNKRLNITGLLACLPNYFFQILEGNRDEIHDLLSVLEQDSRHFGIRVLCETSINHRDFPLWSMAHFDLDDKFCESFQMLERVAKSSTPHAANVSGVLLMLKGLSPVT